MSLQGKGRKTSGGKWELNADAWKSAPSWLGRDNANGDGEYKANGDGESFVIAQMG